MKVHFFQDNTFFRTAKGTNPFFDPIIQVCEENGIEWKVWTTVPTPKCGYPPEKVGYFRRFAMGSVWFWRVAHLFLPMATWRFSWLFGRLMRPFVRKRFGADLFITVAGNLCEQLVGIAPEVRNIDIQHGVIYSKHRGYFDDTGRLREVYQTLRQREFWLYGQGYADCFFKHPENERWLGRLGASDCRVKIIGDVLRQEDEMDKVENCKSRQYIVVSLQFTSDFPRQVLQSWERDLCRYLEQIQEEALYKHYKVVLKQHPRYNGCYDIGLMLLRFPWLSISDLPHTVLKKQAIYHITYMSTTAFEYAAEGVPTLFTESDSNRLGIEIFYDEFRYPLPPSFKTLKAAVESVEEWDRQSERVKAWQRRFYKPLDVTRICQLLGLR